MVNLKDAKTFKRTHRTLSILSDPFPKSKSHIITEYLLEVIVIINMLPIEKHICFVERIIPPEHDKVGYR